MLYAIASLILRDFRENLQSFLQNQIDSRMRRVRFKKWLFLSLSHVHSFIHNNKNVSYVSSLMPKIVNQLFHLNISFTDYIH